MRYPLGQPVRISTTVRDVTGTLVNPATLTLTVKKPDAATQSYATPANDGTGLYHQDVPTADIAQLGHYQYSWVSTGTGAGVTPSGGFDVYDPFEVTVLSLQDAKDMLNITSSTDDTEIYRKIATIEASLEMMTGGPIITRQITAERTKVGQGYRTLTVRSRPLVTVVSITDIASGTSMPITDLDPDLVTGVIRRKLQLPFWSRGPFYSITYTAGLGTAVPPSIAEAAAIILRHLWETQRAGGVTVPGLGDDETVTLPGWGYAIPNRAAELLAPFAYEVYV